MPTPTSHESSRRPKRDDLHPFAFLACGWNYRRLILRLAKRRIESRYRGSLLGAAWAILQPLLILAIYTFVFSFVLQSEWRTSTGESRHFAVVFFSGLILYTLFSECLVESPGLMAAHRAYINQAVFPTETLPWVVLVSATVNFLISSGLLIGLYLAILGPPPLTVLFAPLVVLPVALAALGASWLISSLGVFLKDIAPIISLFAMALLFLSPILYPADLVPDRIQFYYRLNPFVPLLEMWRGLLFDAVPIDWPSLIWVTTVAWILAWLGWAWFMKTKKAFADVV